MVRIGIIGYGYWGPNLVRNFFQNNDYIVVKVADLSIDRLEHVKKNYPTINTTTNANNILLDPKIDAVVIATPVKTHYSLAKKALENNKHVLIEKPMTTQVTQALELGRLARKNKKVLMIDHTFLYTDAVRKIKSLVANGDIGTIQYFDSTRTNLGLFQNDIDVLWDLAAHDIAILNYVVAEKPITIQAIGTSHTNNNINNIGFLILKYKSGLIAHFNCSWSFPVKIRTIIIGGTKKMIVYNDVEPSEKVKIYDKGYKVKKNQDNTKIQIDYREGDIQIPKIDLTEALAHVVTDFLSAIVNKTKPLSDWKSGVDVVKILALAEMSLKKRGKEISFD